jgi:hypothetical protein
MTGGVKRRETPTNKYSAVFGDWGKVVSLGDYWGTILVNNPVSRAKTAIFRGDSVELRGTFHPKQAKSSW